MWEGIKKYWLLLVGALVTIIGFIFKDDIRSKVIQEIDSKKTENDINLEKADNKIKTLKEEKKELEEKIEDSQEEVVKLKDRKKKLTVRVKHTNVDKAKKRMREIAKGTKTK